MELQKPEAAKTLLRRSRRHLEHGSLTDPPLRAGARLPGDAFRGLY